MPNFSILSYKTNKELFAGNFPSMAACLEAAINKNLDLSYADLKQKNLINGNFDGAHMPYALFSGANLTGANMSEANLTGSIFDHSDLYNTCLCFTNLSKCDFRESNFGGTDISGANLSYSTFSTMSCLDLDFTMTENMNGCIYVNPTKEICSMSNRPIVIKGMLSTPIIIFDTMIKIGNTLFQKDIFPFLIRALEHTPLLEQDI